MPAWGVRTALTALRTFMAEPGTAGQVGGLEAPADVRRRLAKDSRQWRCEMGCGRKSNLETMRDWWAVCREKGVKVDEEGSGEGTQMEVLPEGVNLEARGKEDKGKSKEVPQQGFADSKQQPQSIPTFQRSQQSQEPSKSQHPPAPPEPKPPSQADSGSQSNLQPPPASYTHTDRTISPIPHTHTPTPESAQSHAESYLSSSELTTESRQRRPMMSVHAPPVAAAAAAVNNPSPLQTQQQHQQERQDGLPTVTIDRAIAFVFLMLILMVLKKIFYPGGLSGPEGVRYVDGNRAGGFYMEREI